MTRKLACSFAFALSAAACSAPAHAPAPASVASSTSSAKAASFKTSKRHGEGEFVALLQRDAKAMRPLMTSPFVQRFLDATRGLPAIATRRIYRDKDKTHFYTGSQTAALPSAIREALIPIEVDEERYFDADVADPLHYARPLDVAISRGLELPAGSRILDFGYGAIGHLRLLASLGIDAVGVDVRPELPFFYGEPGDTGTIPGIDGATSGRLRVLHGFFPTDAKLKAEVGTGYDFVISKNTLKKGYIHPDRPAPDKWLIHLGVDDATFLGTFHDLLKPRGRMLVYNIYVPIPLDEPFKPMSDGRSPFSKEQWESAGFDVEAFDQDDSVAIRKVLATTDETDGEGDRSHFHSLYTLVRRKD